MDISKRIKAFFILLKADRELKQAVKRADKLSKEKNTRYYVLPNSKHVLKVYCWADIKRMRQYGLFSNRARQADFIFESFYYTPDRFGNGKLTDTQLNQKRRAWLNYVAQVRRLI